MIASVQYNREPWKPCSRVICTDRVLDPRYALSLHHADPPVTSFLSPSTSHRLHHRRSHPSPSPTLHPHRFLPPLDRLVSLLSETLRYHRLDTIARTRRRILIELLGCEATGHRSAAGGGFCPTERVLSGEWKRCHSGGRGWWVVD